MIKIIKDTDDIFEQEKTKMFLNELQKQKPKTMKKAELYIVKQVIVEWVCPHCGIANRCEMWQNLLKDIKFMRCENCLEESERI